MSAIIITGASGFVGQNLSRHLYENGFEIQQFSLREVDWKNNIDTEVNTVIHLAGKAHDTENTSQPSEYFKVNTELTMELFDVFLKSKIQNFIYFSSVKAVADKVADILFENQIPNSKTPYGQSKLKAEEYILSQKISKDKRVFIIRPCMIHGYGNKGNLNLLFNVVKKGIPYPLASFNNQRSFLSIDNLNFLILSILKNENVKSGVYNFADDDFVSTNQVVNIISKVINKKSKLIHVPKSLIKSIAKFGDIIKLPFNTEKLTKLTENYKVSNQKIKDVLELEKLPLSAEEGLEKTIKSFNK